MALMKWWSHILVDGFWPTFLANANQTGVRVGVHLLALEYKHFSDSLWNRRKPIIWEIVEDSKKRRQMLTLRKVWPSREQVGREFTSSPQTFPFGNNCADDVVMILWCNQCPMQYLKNCKVTHLFRRAALSVRRVLGPYAIIFHHLE